MKVLMLCVGVVMKEKVICVCILVLKNIIDRYGVDGDVVGDNFIVVDEFFCKFVYNLFFCGFEDEEFVLMFVELDEDLCV